MADRADMGYEKRIVKRSGSRVNKVEDHIGVHTISDNNRYATHVCIFVAIRYTIRTEVKIVCSNGIRIHLVRLLYEISLETYSTDYNTKKVL